MNKKAEKKYYLDYRVIVKADNRSGSGEGCYVASCPTLGIADDGDTVEQALKNIRSLIAFHLECLQKEGKEIPVDSLQNELVTNTQVQVSFPSLRIAV